MTSPQQRKYNCIAWAAGDRRRWWWPDPPPDDEGYYWPPGVSNEETVAAFVAAFATLGYIPCDGDRVEAGQQRIGCTPHLTAFPRMRHGNCPTAGGQANWAAGRISNTVCPI